MGGWRVRGVVEGAGRSGGGGGAGDGSSGRGWYFSSGFGRFDGGVVDSGVFACGAGREGEEFVKGEDAGFAAFPACGVIQLVC